MLLQNLHAQGHTVIIVTHESSVAAYAERMLVMQDGKLERDTPVSQSAGKIVRTQSSPSIVGETPAVPAQRARLKRVRAFLPR